MTTTTTTAVATVTAPRDGGGRQKKLRKAQKLLRQIEQLEASAEAGQALNEQQQNKVARRAELEAEIAQCS